MYQVIYANPPWAYRNRKTGGSHTSGAAQHYPTLTPSEVAALPVRALVTTPATLWLWATVPLLPEILPVSRPGAFATRPRCSGGKPAGRDRYRFRGEVEVLLFGICGKVRAFRSPLPNVIEAPVGAAAFAQTGDLPRIDRNLHSEPASRRAVRACAHDCGVDVSRI